jgi:acyl transferase domain-containing protein/NADPH:quinone reductase-like Zn-dependent oxidoreductase/acyl carrier protein/NADP-dependent 3-hydroxy acid dehydrogenase YdfG
MTSNRDRSPVAVVGLSFRLPGAKGEALWQALLAGEDLVSEVPPDRWSQDFLLHPNKGEPGTSYTFAAGSIGDVAGFDAAFFGISPREAEQMDPQQRVMLELTWEAFEQAGIPPSCMRGSRCGVYVGLSSVDYAYRRADDLGAIDSTTMTGNAGSIAANRISYVFDLHGPSMVIDTACSSSLVAFHQACQSIRTGECDTALAGGISLHLHPYGFIGFSKASMLSRRGRCGVFDADADGYVRSEGGGVVILKPLVRALADGNRILAVVAGTGVNSDGRKSGLTVPSHDAQAALLRDVYGRAGIAPADIDYYEAHGTGTAVGDPLETRAIGEALGQRRLPGNPLPVGSVKSNLGHLEAAAGMAALVKVLHVLRDRVVPANINLNTVNPAIDLANWNLAPVTEPLQLASDRRLVVGLSAFGFGGTNAHAVLTSFEPPISLVCSTEVPEEPSPKAPSPLLLSARSPEALRAAAEDMAVHLRSRPDLPLRDVIYSAASHRDIHLHRLAARAPDRDGIVRALEEFAATGTAENINVGKYRAEASGPAFIYSGNGSQWVGMGQTLLKEDEVFRSAVVDVDARYTVLGGDSILSELRAPADQNRFAFTEVAQPALFAVQVGLTRMLEHRGVRPIAVCGHSVGEVAAAWASGALTLDQAVRVIYARSNHQGTTRGHGCMTAVTLGRADVQALLETPHLGGQLEIAAINSAQSVTVTGNAEAMSSFETALTQRRVSFQRLAIDYAFHSAAMDPIRDGLLKSLQGLRARATVVPIYSSVTGARIELAQTGIRLGPSYWWRNVREPVKFEAAVRAMAADGVSTFIEIGPRAVLATYLTDITKLLGSAAAVMPSLTRSESGQARVLALIAELEVTGALRNASRAAAGSARYVDLPHYPWQRERYWHPTTIESEGRLTRHIEHPLLGYALAGEALHWENHLDLATLPTYADHAVGGGAVFPAAGYVEMALAAGRARRRIEERSAAAPLVIEELEILAPLLLEADRSRTVRLAVDAADGHFTIVSRERLHDEPWRTHATGRLVEECVAAGRPQPVFPARPEDVGGEAHYEFARSLGLHYGPAFRTVSSVWYLREGLLGTLSTPVPIAADIAVMLLHPAFLDGAFQLLSCLALREHRGSADVPAFLPVRIERLELLQPHRPAAAAWAQPADSQRRSRRSLRADFTLFDAAGAAIASAHGVRFRAVSMYGRAAPRARWLATRAVPMPRRDSARATALPASETLAEHCAHRLHSEERLAGRKRFSLEVEPLLDALCGSFAARALRELAGAQPIDSEALIESGRVAETSAPLLNRLLLQLAEDGLVQPIGGRSLWRSDVTLPEHQDIWTSLIADYPEYAALTARVGAAGLHLAERLRAGVVGAPNPMHSDGGSAWADGCTQQEAADVAQAMLDVIRCAVAAQPPQGRLRVLRVVGMPLAHDLPLLPDIEADRCDFVIGAATQALLDDVRSRWPASAALPSLLIDLDGMAPGEAPVSGFDIVMLGEGIAAAPDPQTRLLNARRLLLDDGRLVVLEQESSRAADMLFGLDPSWWRTEEHAAADRPRFSGPEVWSDMLGRANFDMIEAVHELPNAPSGAYLLIARAGVPPRAAAAVQCEARTWLVLGDAAGYSADLGVALSHELEARGMCVVRLEVASAFRHLSPRCFTLDPHLAAHWDRLLAELSSARLTPDGWIHLAGLDLATGAPAVVRVAAQESRAAVLIAGLQACARRSLCPEVSVVAAQAGTALLPAAVRAALAAAPGADGLRDAALWGIARVAMQECIGRRIRWLDLLEPEPCAANAASLAQEILCPDAEDEILLTLSGRFVPRIAPTTLSQWPAATEIVQERAPRVLLDCSVPGPFRNLLWRAEPDSQPLADDEVEIEVCAAGLNFRDVMYAMGLLPDEAVEDGFCGPTLGMEVSGIVTRVGPGVTEVAPGDAVIAFAPASFSNRVRTRALAVTPKPAAWSFAAAATVPTAFFTAYYALHELACLREGERVLIHGGAGGVGIAAIQLAKHLGAEIFVTAGTEEKRDFVRLLGADHVFDSRSLAFADEVLGATGGAGVDVILNSLAGDAIPRNLRLLRPFGRMLELGKRDFYENSRVGLRPFRNNISYFGIDADQLLAQRPDTARRVFIDLMALFADGTLTPLPHRTFDAQDIAGAFRHMQASRHIGKIVVTFPPGFAPALHAAIPEAPPVAIRADATYLVTGGLSGFGLRTARWLVGRGARHLVLLSRRGGAGSPEAAAQLLEFAEQGVTLAAPACDVADRSQLSEAFDLISDTMPPLAGVVHAAMVIEDALLCDVGREQLHRVLAPKMLGALNLHDLTRAQAIDFFILYSSATTLFGNPGQGAYVAANLGLEALADERRRLGLPVTCVGWGPIGDAGYLARNERILDALVGRMGGEALQSDDALSALEHLLATPAGNRGFLDLDWNTLSRSLPAGRAPKFSELTRLAAGGDGGAHAGDSAQDLRRRLSALPAAAALAELTVLVRAEVAEILRIAPERLEPAISLMDMGMDSLMAVELAAAIEARLDIRLSALALSGGPTIENIVERIQRLLLPAEAAAEAAPNGALAAQVSMIANQHAGELSAENVAQMVSDISAGSDARSLTRVANA